MNYPIDRTIQPEEIVFCDLETTGLDVYGSEILTGHFIACDYSTLGKRRELSLKFRPNKWDDQAENSVKIHGITHTEAMKFPDKSESLSRLLMWTSPRSVLCCHANINTMLGAILFDVALLKTQCLYSGLLWRFNKLFPFVNESTHTFAREAKNRGFINPQGFRLNELAEYFKITLKHHDARSDCAAAESIYRKLRSIELSHSIL